MSNFGQRLYRGEVSYDFVSRWKRWFAFSAVLLVVAIAALLIRGLNLGIEFKGGADFAIPNATCSVAEAREVAEIETGGQTIVTVAGSGTMRVQTEPLTSPESIALSNVLGDTCGVLGTDITVQVVGPTWGAQISTAALQGLAIFLVLVTIFLSIYFEWRMAVGALVALIHDLVITIGIYAAFGLQVTPATAIGVLTILAYSLYDTVVVYDKVKENTRGIAGQSIMTYSEAANLAVNQTVVRSIKYLDHIVVAGFGDHHRGRRTLGRGDPARSSGGLGHWYGGGHFLVLVHRDSCSRTPEGSSARNESLGGSSASPAQASGKGIPRAQGIRCW